MADAPITVFASFVPKAGQQEEVAQVLRGMVGPTRKEPGCRRYDLYCAAEGAVVSHLVWKIESAVSGRGVPAPMENLRRSFRHEFIRSPDRRGAAGTRAP